MRAERSGRDGPGPTLRGGSTTSRGRSSFNDRDGGRPMVMSDQVSLPPNNTIKVNKSSTAFLWSPVLLVQDIDWSCKKYCQMSKNVYKNTKCN